jgi:hypothetical protein
MELTPRRKLNLPSEPSISAHRLAYKVSRQECRMLDFMQQTGERSAFSYAYLSGVFLDQAGKLVFEFTGYRVEVRGRCLQKIYDEVLRLKVEWIQEQGSEPVTVRESEPVVILREDMQSLNALESAIKKTDAAK